MSWRQARTRTRRVLRYAVSNAEEARWADIDFETETWTIQREDMKRRDVNRGVFVIPLPPFLLSAMREWHRIDGEDAVYVCPRSA